MGNFRSIEEVERMARIVSDMEKSKLIDKGSLYNECAAMEDAGHDVSLTHGVKYSKNTISYMRR